MNDKLEIWTDKYKPASISNLTSNTTALKSMYAWLSSYDKNKKEALKMVANKKQKKNAQDTKKNKKSDFKSCMLVTGGHGVGKSTMVDVILRELHYNVQKIHISILKSGKSIDDVVNKIISQANIMTMINSGDHLKYAIIIDEIESITSAADKVCIVGLQKLNDIHWYCPIIFISNNQHNKLLSDIKKTSYEVKLWPPYPSEMRKILLKVANGEGIKINHDYVIDKIINHSQGDIRRLIFTLQDIKYAYEDALITFNIIDEYCETTSRKDIDIDLYTATDNLLYNYESIDECLHLFESEKVLLPLMMHQNYIKMITTNYRNGDEQYRLINEISDSLSMGDVIENYIYGDQNWGMQEIHGFHTCIFPSYHITKNLPPNPTKIKILFATDLNRTSIKKINKKNIVNTDRCFKNMNINDYIYMNKIIRNLISDNNIEECVKLLKDYDIKLEHIESLLKIDKIKETKTGLTSKQKTEFVAQLNKQKK